MRQNVERFNIKVMAATVLNSTQVHLLQMFQVDDSQKGLEELKELLYSYYSSNPQPIGFRGNLLVKRPKFFYCTYSLGITETS